MIVDIKKKYRTRDGQAVRILATDLKPVAWLGDCPVAATIETTPGHEEVYRFTSTGQFARSDYVSKNYYRDLVEVPETFEVTRFVNVYEQNGKIVVGCGCYVTEECAKGNAANSDRKYIGTYPYTIRGEVPVKE